MRTSVYVAVAAATIACGAQAQSTVYKWTDADGKVHFSDTPPPQSAKGVTQKRVSGGNVDVSQLPYAAQLAMKSHPVTLFTAAQCGDPCASGRKLLSDRGIPYTERDAQASPADTETVKKHVGALKVPLLLVGGDALKGYDPGAWHAALDGAGYPRTKLPGTLAPKPQVATAPPPPPPAEGQPEAQPEAAPPEAPK